MKRYLFAGLGAILLLFPLFAYTYVRGANDGIKFYRHSKQFQMTLSEMYKLGLIEACSNRAICKVLGNRG